ncbi:hypothetical protein Pcinc_011228 [Petrolisthes cinctipes]|uniref:Sulfotransferase domain-containing protein n=1 Tax=Petrolisthes cinctipes TaxID=88211 RepID=A0AAE1KSS2_PETCI|nr:hypothetical protein Pcinc_011228 [Petrolisthes cinctipes]
MLKKEGTGDWQDTSTPARRWVEEVSEGEIKRMVDRGFKGYSTLVRAQPGSLILKPRYADLMDKLYNFEFRPDDILIMTYPKSGTTWMQELVWSLTHPDHLHQADFHTISSRSSFLEVDVITSLETQQSNTSLMSRFWDVCGRDSRPEDGIQLQMIAQSPSSKQNPRIIKTHLPFTHLPPNLLETCKVIYMSRDPRDVCVSYYHFCRLIATYQFEGSFNDFVQSFIRGETYYGEVWDHCKAAWTHRAHHNLHFISYEALQSDLTTSLTSLASFLGLHASPQFLKIVEEHASFTNMKLRHDKMPLSFSSKMIPGKGSFFREGVCGTWTKMADPDMQTLMSHWIQQRESHLGFGLPFNQETIHI